MCFHAALTCLHSGCIDTGGTFYFSWGPLDLTWTNLQFCVATTSPRRLGNISKAFVDFQDKSAFPHILYKVLRMVIIVTYNVCK